MAINIQNIVNALRAKINAADSDLSVVELGRLAQANRVVGDLQNAVRFRNSRYPEPDRFNQGRIIWDSDDGEFRISQNYKWTAIDLVDSDAVYQAPKIFQGQVAGFNASGGTPSTTTTDIEKYDFAAATFAVDAGDLAVGVRDAAGASSVTHGYVLGGQPGATRDAQKFPFTSNTGAAALSSQVPGFEVGTRQREGISASTYDYGYIAGEGSPATSLFTQRISFVNDTWEATRLNELTTSPALWVNTAGISGPEYGYISGGNPVPTFGSRTYKFPYTSDTVIDQIPGLNMSPGRQFMVGNSSSTNGYRHGGTTPISPSITTGDTWTFAADALSTSVNNLTIGRSDGTGFPSQTDAYYTGGAPTDALAIEKFPFANTNPASDLGDLRLFSASLNTGHQQ